MAPVCEVSVTAYDFQIDLWLLCPGRALWIPTNTCILSFPGQPCHGMRLRGASRQMVVLIEIFDRMNRHLGCMEARCEWGIFTDITHGSFTLLSVFDVNTHQMLFCLTNCTPTPAQATESKISSDFLQTRQITINFSKWICEEQENSPLNGISLHV